MSIKSFSRSLIRYRETTTVIDVDQVLQLAKWFYIFIILERIILANTPPIDEKEISATLWNLVCKSLMSFVNVLEEMDI